MSNFSTAGAPWHLARAAAAAAADGMVKQTNQADFAKKGRLDKVVEHSSFICQTWRQQSMTCYNNGM
jgi:hypothetical protein